MSFNDMPYTVTAQELDDQVPSWNGEIDFLYPLLTPSMGSRRVHGR